MNEPVNHRAEAERWLGYATEDDFVDTPPGEIIGNALIAIAHALLAGPAPVKMEPPADMSGFPGFAE